MNSTQRAVIDRKRLRIDIVDEQLAVLIDKRRRMSLELQQYKSEEGLPAVDESREQHIGERLYILGFSRLAAGAVSDIARACRLQFGRRRQSTVEGTSRPDPGGSTKT